MNFLSKFADKTLKAEIYDLKKDLERIYAEFDAIEDELRNAKSFKNYWDRWYNWCITDIARVNRGVRLLEKGDKEAGMKLIKFHFNFVPAITCPVCKDTHAVAYDLDRDLDKPICEKCYLLRQIEEKERKKDLGLD